MAMNDDEITALFLQRSETAISETKNKYGRFCKKIAVNILNNESDAEECENDTYLNAWNAIPPQMPKILCAFIGAITRNLALNKLRDSHRQKRNGEYDVMLSELEGCLSSLSTVEDEYDNALLAKHISNFLLSLNKESRMIFVRRYWCCQSVLDESHFYGVSESQIKSSLFRTRNKLSEYLEEQVK